MGNSVVSLSFYFSVAGGEEGEEPASLSWLHPLRLLLLVHCRPNVLRDNSDSPLPRSFYFSAGDGEEEEE